MSINLLLRLGFRSECAPLSLERIHLRKLLQLFYLPARGRTSALRSDIRQDISRERRTGESSGGDFHVPFWADVKAYIAGEVDLNQQVRERVDANNRRARLYPELARGFLTWWNERRRWTNEPYEFIRNDVKAQHIVPSLRCIVKVENLISLRVGETSRRLIYPYFCEDPALPEEGGRIGLWLLGQSLTEYPIEEMRILDVLRGRAFATRDVPLQGDEERIFLANYQRALDEWRRLREEYG